MKLFNNQKGGADALVILLIVVAIAAATFILVRIDQSDRSESTFTDVQDQEQVIESFDDCMDLAMPREEVDGVTYCTAPDGKVFSNAYEISQEDEQGDLITIEMVREQFDCDRVTADVRETDVYCRNPEQFYEDQQNGTIIGEEATEPLTPEEQSVSE